jgi:hypothetical protein
MSNTLQEQQMLDCIREQNGDDTFKLLIERREGRWEITMVYKSAGYGDNRREGSATGASFDEAWDRLKPNWARRPRLELVSVTPKD